MDGPHDLERFVEAQAPVYDEVVRELSSGRKRSHWVWFIFPQLNGLGRSEMAQKYAIASRAEARAYAAHPILGSRLRQCTDLVVAVQGRGIEQILGEVDAAKFRSCMTLFRACAEDRAAFDRALEKYFSGLEDAQTMRLLGSSDM